jgi:transcriptional regulator with XRE-family HTH domain
VRKLIVRGLPAKPCGRTVWMLVGGRLRLRRAGLDLAIGSVAEELRIEPSVYEGYEAGVEQVPALVLTEIADLFRVPVLWFFQDVVAGEEEDELTAVSRDPPPVYRVATVEERSHFLADSFRKLDLAGQQHLLAIAAALCQSNQGLARKSGRRIDPAVRSPKTARSNVQRVSKSQNSSRKSK